LCWDTVYVPVFYVSAGMSGVDVVVCGGLDGTRAHHHHQQQQQQLCAGGSASHSMMHETGAMQPFSAAAAAAPEPVVVGSQHHRGQMPPSQFPGSLPAHHHSHAVVDNVYASVPGTYDTIRYIICTEKLTGKLPV